MPLYSDSNYYYSGGSSQLYSPYYTPGLYSVPSVSSAGSAYAPYSSTYNRALSGSYVVPLTPPRTPTYTTSLLPRYQPKLSTITETSPLISVSRHTGLMPLTRIQSPKINTYPTHTSSVLPKYIAPRPIAINTADIDVSSSRYRRRKQEEQELREEEEAKRKRAQEEAQKATTSSPTASTKKRSSEKEKVDTPETEEESDKRRTARTTIKRNRAVVRLSTIRSRSKERGTKSTSSGTESSSPEPKSKIFRDLPQAPTTEKVSWRDKLADDLAAIPTWPPKKSPGDIIRERYLIQAENKDDDAEAIAARRAARLAAEASAASEKPIEEVVVEIDPIDHSIRRLSIPNCPTFHDICEDISSDKIDDDLNAGALRRRASLIQEQEQELMNQLQKSSSGTFQMIHLERQGSQDSLAEETQAKRSSKRKSKKIRHKITAIVEVDNQALLPILQEKDEPRTPTKKDKDNATPKFTFNVESVEEHNETNKIFKLPKKKSVKKSAKPKEIKLPEGFMPAQPKPKSSPVSKTPKKKETFISTAEIFTFDPASVEKSKEEELHKQQAVAAIEVAKLTKIENEEKDTQLKATTVTTASIDTPKISVTAEPSVQVVAIKVEEKPKAPMLQTAISLDSSPPKSNKISSKPFEKTQSFSAEEIKSPKLERKTALVMEPPKPIAAKKSLVIEEKKEALEKKPLVVEPAKPMTATKQLVVEAKAETAKASDSFVTLPKTTPTLSASASLDVTTTDGKASTKSLEKSQSMSVDESTPKVATPKPIRKHIQKSESGEDFWSQIGSRETIYMANRKKSLHELFESLEKAEQPADEAATSKESPKAEQKVEAVTPVVPVTKPTSPLKVTSPKKDVAESPKESAKPKTNEIDKTQTAASTTTTTTTTTVVGQAATKITDTSTSSKTPKINSGQEAKSPEQPQQNKFTANSSGGNRDKDKTPINNATATAQEDANAIAKHAKLAAPAVAPVAATMGAPTATTTTITATKQAQAQQQQQQQPPRQEATKLPEADKKSSVGLKSPTDADKTKLPAVAKPKVAGKTSKASPTAAPAKAKTSPIAAAAAAINADQFIAVAPAKTSTSPTKPKNASPKSTTVAAKAKTTAAATIASTPAAVAAAITTTTSAATATASAATTGTTATAATGVVAAAATGIVASPTSDNSSDSKTRAGNNLSKFATVSNLAQCLQDVDADLEDYIPSSAENSDDDLTDDSSYDLSSADGCENLSASMKKKLRQRRKKEKQAEQARFDPQKKIKIDPSNKCYVKDEAPRYPLVATPRPLWKREKIVYPAEDSDDSDSDESGSTEETEDSEECTTSEEYEDDLNPSSGGATGNSSTTSKENSSIIRMSTCSNDSGFEGGTAPSSPKKMLECDVNCHKKCERLTANLCGVNQKLIVEALASVKRGARETRDSPSTPPSLNPAYKIDGNEEHDETSYTYSQFQKSGRFTAPATVIPRFKNYTVDDFHFLTVLGKGSFGKVLLAELRDTTYYYAVKCLKKDVVLEDDDVDSTLIERKVLALGTKHPYLCHLFCTFQTESHLFFVMEYLNGGDLMFHIQESGRFSEERARFYGAEIISGLKFLHKKGIIYRDLKLDNVLLDYEGHVRIADFGMCKLQIYLDKTADSFCGTPDYMAPEIIKGEKYNQNVDWWSFGVLLYEMLIGQSPFSGCDEDELFWSICNEIPWFPVYISAEATSILKGLLEKDYAKRIGSQYSLGGEISEHIFFAPIDWNLLEKRQLEPPLKPQVKHPLDTQYFDRVFTRERVRLTPIDKDILQSMDQKQFLGFTYTNPHIALD